MSTNDPQPPYTVKLNGPIEAVKERNLFKRVDVRARAYELSRDPLTAIEMERYLNKVIDRVESFRHNLRCSSLLRSIPSRSCDCGVSEEIALWAELIDPIR